MKPEQSDRQQLRPAGLAKLRSRDGIGLSALFPESYGIARSAYHSVTLALATLNIVQLPSQLVESVIALSIVQAWSLAAFNVGVEIGQVALVLLAAPLLYALRQFAPVRISQAVLTSAASLVVLVGGFWFWQRVWG